jgi:hypothetical protein
MYLGKDQKGTDQIAPLRSQLFYPESILLVREEYKTLYNDIWSYKNIPRVGGVVVSGQRGIGMHILLTGLLH